MASGVFVAWNVQETWLSITSNRVPSACDACWVDPFLLIESDHLISGMDSLKRNE